MSDRYSAGCFEAGDIPFTIETNRAGLAALVRDVLRDLRVEGERGSPVGFEVLHTGAPPPSNPWAVWRNGEPRAMTVADSYVVTHLLREISRLMFERTGNRVHLHGAALVRHGRAVVLAGRSRAGKSTLAAWLTYRGWGFLTDEAALVDPEALTVAPFWRPINIRRPGPLDFIVADAPPEKAEVLVPASTIGSLAPATPLAGIAFPCFTSEVQQALTRMSPAAALLELTQHFPGLIAGGRVGFRRLAQLCEAVPAYTLQFHGLDEAEGVLRTLVAGAA